MRLEVLIRYSKRVEVQIQGVQDKSETLKSEVCGVSYLKHSTQLANDIDRLSSYNQRHNSHKRARRHEMERTWCSAKTIPLMNKYCTPKQDCLLLLLRV